MVKFRNRDDALSANLEDRRAVGGRGVVAGGGLVGVIALVLFQLLSGGGGGASSTDIADIFDQIQTGGSGSTGTVDPADESLVQEMSDALDDIQTVWASPEEGVGGAYRDAKLVLFSGAVTTGGCGNAPASVGPFYCPADEKAYIDLSFFKELDDRFGAPGDFARVYVLAHEIGHHVQNVLGDSAQIREIQEQEPDRANELSVALELQADCYAGVWGSSAQDRGLIEPGDIEEGLAAAAAVGDDALGNGDQESWTHGSAASRQRWFQVGFETGDLSRCNTFAVPFSDL